MKSIGIDIGSTYTKYCVMADHEILDLFIEPTPVRQKEYFQKKLPALKEQYGDFTCTSCGYGRNNIASSHVITELSALAQGIQYISPDTKAVLDIGGQDTKLILQKGGKITAFFLNDQCAAGCGMFLSNVSRLLGFPFTEISFPDDQQPDFQLSSTCAVFAQTEIVNLVADGKEEEEIIRAVVIQILHQAKKLLLKAPVEELALSGGFTQINGIQRIASKILEIPVQIPDHAVYLSAIGCALKGESNFE